MSVGRTVVGYLDQDDIDRLQSCSRERPGYTTEAGSSSIYSEVVTDEIQFNTSGKQRIEYNLGEFPINTEMTKLELCAQNVTTKPIGVKIYKRRANGTGNSSVVCKKDATESFGGSTVHFSIFPGATVKFEDEQTLKSARFMDKMRQKIACHVTKSDLDKCILLTSRRGKFSNVDMIVLINGKEYVNPITYIAQRFSDRLVEAWKKDEAWEKDKKSRSDKTHKNWGESVAQEIFDCIGIENSEDSKKFFRNPYAADYYSHATNFPGMSMPTDIYDAIVSWISQVFDKNEEEVGNIIFGIEFTSLKATRGDVNFTINFNTGLGSCE